MEEGNLKLMLKAVEAANLLMSKVQVSLNLVGPDLNDQAVRQFLTMHATCIQEYYDVLARGAGIWQEPVVHIGQALAGPAQPSAQGNLPLPPLPSQVLSAAGQIAERIPK